MEENKFNIAMCRKFSYLEFYYKSYGFFSKLNFGLDWREFLFGYSSQSNGPCIENPPKMSFEFEAVVNLKHISQGPINSIISNATKIL